MEVFSKKIVVVEVPIIYNSFTFISIRRKYSIYKRELYTILVFT